jgi:hypothetical protein
MNGFSKLMLAGGWQGAANGDLLVLSKEEFQMNDPS